MSLVVQAGGPAEMSTKQRKMIHGLGRSLGLNHHMLGNLSETMFRLSVGELNREQASDLIDHLLSLEAWSEYADDWNG